MSRYEDEDGIDGPWEKAMARKSKPRAPKGTPTDLNVYALSELFGNATEIRNGTIEAPSVPHIRRCLAAGFLTVEGGREGTLKLTEAGRLAVNAYRAKWSGRTHGGPL